MVSHSATTPRSYVVETPSGELRRNRAHLRTRSDFQLTEAPTSTNYSRPVTRLQTGTAIHAPPPPPPPDRLRY